MLKTQEEVVTRQGTGVIVGRFQVHSLTDGHIQLINSVIARHYTVIIAVGVSASKTTRNNPLNFEMRRRMIINDIRLNKLEDTNLIVIDINDHKSDLDWTVELDKKISDNTPISDNNVVLYGSRDSFIKHYSGKYTVKELLQEVYTTGTVERMKKSHSIYDSEDFRAGVIWATQNRYPVVWSTVDVAIFNEDGSKLLLGQKPHEARFRFIGGFVEIPTMVENIDILKYNVAKETYEETGLEITDVTYIGSYKIYDWRFRSEKDCIMTNLFSAKICFGRPEPADDISALKWFDVDELVKDYENLIEPEHHVLLAKLIEHRNKMSVTNE